MSSFLKKYFSANKKFGSKDRRQVSHLCYCYFRLGKTGMSLTIEEKLLAALFVCSENWTEVLNSLKPEWNERCQLSLNKKLLLIGDSISLPGVFPWKDELSDGIDFEKFCGSFLIQPDLFLRVRPAQEENVMRKLQNAGIDFERLSKDCLALPNTSKIAELIKLDKEAVIQDHNSQMTGELIRSEMKNQKLKIKLWDCCAGSGGKSIMLYDINPDIQLTVSDVRESILANLKKRFYQAGILKYKEYVTDLTDDTIDYRLSTNDYDLILADVPCTGSGTWARTPEQLYFFDEKKIAEFSTRQKKIVSNVIPHLRPGGVFVYITCSAFKKENEEVIDFIKDKFGLQLKQMEVLKGYDKKADSMFIAILQ